jgi:hypothetical protein
MHVIRLAPVVDRRPGYPPDMSRALGGALVGVAVVLFLSACGPSPQNPPAEGFLGETRSFCADVGAYVEQYEELFTAGKEWPDWHASASSLVEALDDWQRKVPDGLPADIDAAIDRYADSFVARLRGSDNVQALRHDCDGIVDSLGQYVATLR